MCGGRRRRGGGGWTGGRGRGRKDGEEEEEAPVLSGAVCFCLNVCSHTVEINLPSGLSLWNKERRKLARSDTLREMERDKTGTVRQGGIEEKCRWGWGSGTLFCPHLYKLQTHPPKSGRSDFQFHHQHHQSIRFSGSELFYKFRQLSGRVSSKTVKEIKPIQKQIFAVDEEIITS